MSAHDRARRKELRELIKLFKKGDLTAQVRLRALLEKPGYLRVFKGLYTHNADDQLLQSLRARSERTEYKVRTFFPVQGGAPGMGKKK